MNEETLSISPLAAAINRALNDAEKKQSPQTPLLPPANLSEMSRMINQQLQETKPIDIYIYPTVWTRQQKINRSTFFHYPW